MQKVIVWFRQDLRLSDHPALLQAAEHEAEIIPLYILEDGIRPWGGASRWWLHHSLISLSKSLNGHLCLRRGNAQTVLSQLIQETGAQAVYWSRRYDPLGIAIDTSLKSFLRELGIEAKSFNAGLLHEPWELKPYRVFTPFWRACRLRNNTFHPTLAPSAIVYSSCESEPLSSWELLPQSPNWAKGLEETWKPGESAAQERLHHFLTEDLRGYAQNRDRPDLSCTSRLSPYLHWGEISPRQIWSKTHIQCSIDASLGSDLEKFLSEIGWREFAHHLLYHFPKMIDEPLDARFNAFPWATDNPSLKAWQQGRTGFPFVDAGMKELWRTGWMHNRVRMIAASVLTKDLLIHWKEGEAWFWDTLVDANMANNIVSWQWVAGCGADASPYFRVFNPTLQSEKFDPNGSYVKRWAPQKTPPLVDHAMARERALAIWSELRK